MNPRTLLVLAALLAPCRLREDHGWIAGKPDIAFAPYGDDYASKPTSPRSNTNTPFR